MSDKPVFLDKWTIQRDVSEDSEITNSDNTHAIGKVYNHPNFKDGTCIKTTTIVNWVDNKIRTEAGILYYLMTPDPDYLNYLIDEGRDDLLLDIKRTNNN